ncbi:MAG: DUF3784 domain-containing protein [Candidatus Methanoplasma sp.]|nr:DUF3784 domain-containing protein [Candidatus Methanoplasma sp.]
MLSNEKFRNYYSCVYGCALLVFLLVAVRNWGGILTGLNAMTKREREKYNIPLISKAVGILGMGVAISIIVLFCSEDRHKWIGWSLFLLSVMLLTCFAIISVIGDGKYLRKKQ